MPWYVRVCVSVGSTILYSRVQVCAVGGLGGSRGARYRRAGR